ncbi:MAG: hypothetical protein AB1295_00910 [Candidatus Micrarchaeota archaeon]
MADQRDEIEAIKERNRRVEADKAWETSNARKLVIAVFTYLLAVAILISIGAPQPFLNALIPTAGFLLSTMTFGFLKKWWVHNIYGKRGG